MPSKLSSENLAASAAVDETEKSYRRLLAFLDLASGSTFAIARCNLPSLRKEILQRVAIDAKTKGVVVREVDISSKYSGDFVAAVKAGLDGTPAAGRLAVMVTGIDGLIYQSASPENLSGEGRTPFVARLNFNREYVSRELPFPVILWLESESLTLLLKQAPDFTQWISGHFHFGGPAAEAKALDQLLESYKSLPSQPATETRKQLQEFTGLLQELNETKGRDDVVSLRKRLAVLNALAERYFQLSDARMAQKFCIEALELSKKLNDRRAESNVLGNLGLAYAALGETCRAIELYERALAAYRDVGDGPSGSKVLTNLGAAYQALGDTRRALELYEQALAAHREVGDRPSESKALGNLGTVFAALGDTRRAIECYEQSLAIKRAIGDRQGEGNALGNLGTAYQALGDTQRALELYEQALAIHREIGDRQSESKGLDKLGTVYAASGDTRRAIEYYERSLAIKRGIGDRRGEGNTLGNLGAAYQALGEVRRAIEYFDQAIAIAQGVGDQRSEGIGLFNVALSFKRLGNRPQAIASAEAALAILEEIEDPRATKVRQALAEWRKG